MERKAFLLSPVQRAAALIFLAALFSGLILLGILPTAPAYADSGGFPTKTPTLTPSPTVTSSPTATATATATQQGAVVVAETAIPPTPTNTEQAVVTPTPSGERPNLVCWPFALIALFVAILVASMLLGNRP